MPENHTSSSQPGLSVNGEIGSESYITQHQCAGGFPNVLIESTAPLSQLEDFRNSPVIPLPWRS